MSRRLPTPSAATSLRRPSMESTARSTRAPPRRAKSSGNFWSVASRASPGWRTTRVPSSSVSSIVLRAPSSIAEYMVWICCIVTIAVTTPSKDPPGRSSRRETTSPGSRSVRVTIGSLITMPASAASRCRWK